MSGAFSLAGQLRLAGAALVLLGLGHLILPRVLGWPGEFTALRPLTRQIMHAHTHFIGLTCLLLGLAPLLLATDLLTGGRLPAAVLGAESIFWGLRWIAQLVAFPPALWRHRPLYRAGYLLFGLLWTWVTAVFGAALAATLQAPG